MIKQSKQDRTYSRTAEDLERKYDLGLLVQGKLQRILDEINKSIISLQDKLDAKTSIVTKDKKHKISFDVIQKDGVDFLGVYIDETLTMEISQE